MLFPPLAKLLERLYAVSGKIGQDFECGDWADGLDTVGVIAASQLGQKDHLFSAQALAKEHIYQINRHLMSS